MSTTKNFDQFVADLKQPDTWGRLGPQLALIAPGSWDHLLLWAGRQGYAFTLADIDAAKARYPGMLAADPGIIPMNDGIGGDPAATPSLWTAASLQTAMGK